LKFKKADAHICTRILIIMSPRRTFATLLALSAAIHFLLMSKSYAFSPIAPCFRGTIGDVNPKPPQHVHFERHRMHRNGFNHLIVAASKDKKTEKKHDWHPAVAGLLLGLFVSTNAFFLSTASAADATKYDGFAEYAKENKMEQSDVSCFINKCGAETKALFSNPRGIKGVSCLGRCKGEQSCATRCFAEFSSDALNNWLSCTIEENECVKVPKNAIDNSAENLGYSTAVRNFDPTSLVGTWYKTDGLNPNYDLFDCQKNTFARTSDQELDMGIFFRVQRPVESGGGFWENELTEHMVVDTPVAAGALDATPAVMTETNTDAAAGRTMHTSGKMYGLQFSENWFILGESDGKGEIPPFKLVAYKGHTLQGNYEGAFVYAKEPQLPEAAKAAVREAAARGGLNFNDFTVIDNTCPAGEPLNDVAAGTGTSTTDWVDLVIGEGGVIDWISPGWRGEYSKTVSKR
jgi:VDE lipocalin domain